MYQILGISRGVAKQIQNLPPAHKEKFKEALEDLGNNPFYHPAGKIGQLKGDQKDKGWHYRLNQGPNAYRIHYIINDEDRTIKITFVGAHPNY